MNQNKRKKILLILKKNNPNPITELLFSSKFELLISLLLSAKTTDKIVNISTKKLYKIANTPEKMIKIGINKIKKNIKKIGIYNKKAQNIINLSKILLEQYNGKIPNKRKELELLPGIGRKSANIFLNTIFGMNTIGVDTHVFRVCNRTKFANGKNVREIEKKLIKIVPLKFKKHFHNWFVLHGKYICKAKKPLCKSCIINNFCEYKNF